MKKVYTIVGESMPSSGASGRTEQAMKDHKQAISALRTIFGYTKKEFCRTHKMYIGGVVS